jgi:hypothetical protein
MFAKEIILEEQLETWILKSRIFFESLLLNYPSP